MNIVRNRLSALLPAVLLAGVLAISPVNAATGLDGLQLAVVGSPNGTIATDAYTGVFNPGDQVNVLWEGKYYSATVLQITTNNRFLVHYNNYDSSWDEWVDLSRIQALRVDQRTAPPSTSSRLKVGGNVDVMWEGKWYPATILKVGTRGQYYIHYTGYGSNWDEWVTTARIR